jgi:hypothetical protein
MGIPAHRSPTRQPGEPGRAGDTGQSRPRGSWAAGAGPWPSSMRSARHGTCSRRSPRPGRRPRRRTESTPRAVRRAPPVGDAFLARARNRNAQQVRGRRLRFPDAKSRAASDLLVRVAEGAAGGERAVPRRLRALPFSLGCRPPTAAASAACRHRAALAARLRPSCSRSTVICRRAREGATPAGAGPSATGPRCSAWRPRGCASRGRSGDRGVLLLARLVGSVGRCGRCAKRARLSLECLGRRLRRVVLLAST